MHRGWKDKKRQRDDANGAARPGSKMYTHGAKVSEKFIECRAAN